MTKRHRPSRLGLKFLAVAAAALAAALALRALLYDTALPGLLQSAGFESYWYDRYGGAAEDFQSYVSAHSLSVQEALRDTDWTRQHPQVELYLEGLADSSLDTDALEGYGGRVIACADGLLYAYPMPNYFYYDGACRLLSLLCAALCFFVILMPYTALLIRRITRLSRDMEVLAGGDLAVNLPLNDIFEAHMRNDADITAVCTSRPLGSPKNCDYFTIGAGGRITDVSVHPPIAQGCESLEVYVLSKELLLSLVDHCAAHNIHSFSIGVLQAMVGQLKICPYVFDGYAARLQSVAGYFARSMELLDPAVRAQLFDPARPIKTKDQSNPSTYYGPESLSVNSLVSDGCIIEGEVVGSILSRNVRVEKGARVENCILMQGTTIQAGAVLKYAITDKNVRVNPGRMLMGHKTYPLAIAKGEIV